MEVVEHLWPAACPAEVSRLTAERQELYRSRLADSDLVRPVAGAEAFLAALGALGVVRVLATDAPRANVEAVLRRFPLASYFEGTVTSDTVQHGKPHPEIFLAAAIRAKVAPGRCLVAEDSRAGVAAAKAAGCACLGLATNQSEADLRLRGRTTSPWITSVSQRTWPWGVQTRKGGTTVANPAVLVTITLGLPSPNRKGSDPCYLSCRNSISPGTVTGPGPTLISIPVEPICR
jgi:HAD superfamily hydrolase (TIGR01509 family)